MTLDQVPSHPAGDLVERSIRGGAARFAAQALHLVLGVVSTAILARLLAPSDFGAIAMVVALTSFLGLFRDLGLSAVTVQRAELSHGHLSALFWINVLLGLTIALVMAAGSPLVAWFYGVPELRGITIALAFGFVVAGLSIQHSALLHRQMRFGSAAAIELTAQAAGLAAAILSARADAGYWALVVFQLTQQATAAAGAWVMTRWRPGRPALTGIGSLLSFGAGLTGFNVLTHITRNVDNILLGHFTGAGALGLYGRAYALVLLPVDRIRGPISAVVVPALSRLQHEPERFQRYFLTAISVVAAAGMPLVVFLFVFADEAVRLVLGPRWQEAVPLFRLLAPAAFVETFNVLGSWACVPLGRSSRLLRWQIFATAATVGAFLVGVQWGAAGLAAAVSVSTLALRPAAAWYLLDGSPVRPSHVALALLPPSISSLAAGVLTYLLAGALPASLPAVLLLIISACAFALFYLALLLSLPGGQHLKRALTLVRPWLPSPLSAALRIDAAKGQVSA